MSEEEAIQRLIEVAEKEVGYLEKNSECALYTKRMNAGSNNYTKYGYEMHNISPEVMDYPAKWCDCFVDWCFKEAFGSENAEKMLNGFDDYTPASMEKYVHAGHWFDSPKKGDQIFFVNEEGKICHTGIVYDVTFDMVYTIEGNTGSVDESLENDGCVIKKSYNKNSKKIAGYGRPDYKLLENETCFIELKEILEKNEEKRVLVLGTTCAGKSTFIKRLGTGLDMDEELFPLLTKKEVDIVSKTPWTKEIGNYMDDLAKTKLKIFPSQPIFGTVLLDADLIVFLHVSENTMRKRTRLRGVSLEDAKNMQDAIEKEIKSSGIEYLTIEI